MPHQFIPVGISQHLYTHFSKGDDPLPARDKTLVIMMHGFPGGHMEDQGNIFGDLEDILSSTRFDSIRFDFRGCGDSDGESEDFTLTTAGQDLKAVLNWAYKKGYERVAYIGEGLGAAVALMNMNPRVRALVMLWPMLDFRQTLFHSHFPLLETPVSHAEKTVTNNGRKVAMSCLQELLTASLVPELKNLRIPVLVEHGECDRESPITQLELLRRHAAAAPRVDITSYKEGEHGLRKKTEREDLFRHISQFLNKYA